MKKWVFSKNCLTLLVSGREKNRIFVHTICFGQKYFWSKNSQNLEKTMIILFSAETTQNQKWHLIFEKGVFGMGEKVGFINCVFEKLCSSENTIFIVFSSKHSNCNKQALCWKTIFLKNSGLFFWTWQKRCFCLFLWGFNIFVVCFCVFGRVAKVLKCLFFFPIFGLCGEASSCLFGFGRFRCFRKANKTKTKSRNQKLQWETEIHFF